MDDQLSAEGKARLLAGVDMLRRTGVHQVQVRWSDDEKPIVWFVVAMYAGGQWESASGKHPVAALERLLERLIDGGQCTHCGRPSAFTTEFDRQFGEDALCWTKWDPELKTYRRSCP